MTTEASASNAGSIDPIVTIFHATVPLLLDTTNELIYLNAPRNCYLHALFCLLPYAGTLLADLSKNGSEIQPDATEFSDIYFTALINDKETPLKWHHPIGVLYDRYGPEYTASNQLRVWKLVVYHSKTSYPNSLIPYFSFQTLESLYINTVKEADYVKYGSSRKVMTLDKSSSINLWQGVVQNNLSLVEPLLHHLFHDNPNLKYWPIRIHVRYKASDQSNAGFMQPCLVASEIHTLGDALEQANLIDPTQVADDNAGSGLEKVIVQGYDIVTSTLLSWLYRHMLCVDGWLHIVAITSPQARLENVQRSRQSTGSHETALDV